MMTRKTKGIKTLKYKVEEAISNTIHALDRGSVLPLRLTYSNGFGEVLVSFIDNEMIHFQIMYQTRVLINVLIHEDSFSFYRLGLDNYYLLSLKETYQLFEESKEELKQIIPYLKKQQLIHYFSPQNS